MPSAYFVVSSSERYVTHMVRTVLSMDWHSNLYNVASRIMSEHAGIQSVAGTRSQACFRLMSFYRREHAHNYACGHSIVHTRSVYYIFVHS